MDLLLAKVFSFVEKSLYVDETNIDETSNFEVLNILTDYHRLELQ